MILRDPVQRAVVCRTLCERAGILERLWTSAGPTQLAIDIRDGRYSMTAHDLTMVRVAWAFWDGSGGCTIGECIEKLDEQAREMIGKLLVALGRPDAVMRWLLEFDDAPLPDEYPACGCTG